MKNIHLIKTDKPSRLYEGNLGELVIIQYKTPLKSLHIYITNDEEIKEGDYVYFPTSDEVLRIGNDPFESSLEIVKDNKDCKKIILTTDQDLIKEGVQAIDDDFLEFIVNNPSCEEVEVGYGWIRLTETDNEGYWVSIPDKQFEMQQEEPKPDLPIINGSYGCTIQTKKEEPLEKEWLKTPKWGVRLDKDKLPDFTYVDQWYEGVLYKRNMVQLVYPNSPSFGGLKWKVFETKELAEEWIKNPIIPKEEPKQDWQPTQGEEVWIKVFSNWSKGTYIGYDVTKSTHIVREDERGGCHLFSSSEILPYYSMPNEPKQELERSITIIDPPSGWKYGFPKPIPEDRIEDVLVWLVEQGYPQSEIDDLGDYFSCRYWKQETAVEFLKKEYIKRGNCLPSGVFKDALEMEAKQDQNKYSEEDMKEAYFTAIKSTGEGWNGEYAGSGFLSIEKAFSEGFEIFIEQYKKK